MVLTTYNHTYRSCPRYPRFSSPWSCTPRCSTEHRQSSTLWSGVAACPTFCDRTSLPYIDCIVKEVLRWGTDYNPARCFNSFVDGTLWRPWVCPTWYRRTMSTAATSFQRAPPSSGNSWCVFTFQWPLVTARAYYRVRTILHDPFVFPNPSTFNPSRFATGGRHFGRVWVRSADLPWATHGGGPAVGFQLRPVKVCLRLAAVGRHRGEIRVWHDLVSWCFLHEPRDRIISQASITL